MAETVNFFFAGVVYDPGSQNPALQNFGYSEGQMVSGFAQLTGGLAQAYLSAKAAAGGGILSFEFDPSSPEFFFFFEQPGQGNYDQTKFLPTSGPVRIVSDKGPALLDFTGLLLSGEDGAAGFMSQPAKGGILFSDDNDARALVEGVWVGEGTYNLYIDAGLKGVGQVNFLWGLGGDDKIEVKQGVGYGWGGLGDDAFKGNDGADSFWGGAGRDFAQGNGGADRFFGGDGADELRGEEGDDVLLGGNGDDLLKGGSGNDFLAGGEGADRLFGNDGRDVLLSGVSNFATDGYDSVDGGSGADLLWGQDKAILHGGPGTDTFVFAPTPISFFPFPGMNLPYQPRDIVIDDFDARREKIYIDVDGVDDFATLLAHGSNIHGDVVFDFGGGGKLVIEDVLADVLRAGNFVFGAPPSEAVDPALLQPSLTLDLLFV